MAAGADGSGADNEAAKLQGTLGPIMGHQIEKISRRAKFFRFKDRTCACVVDRSVRCQALGRWPDYSITSSARAISNGGRSSPSARAVLRLMARSNFVGSSTGRGAGLVPCRKRATYAGASG